MTTILIFGGTAAYHIDPAGFATVVEQRVVDTPYGPSPIFYRLENPKSQIPNPKSQTPNPKSPIPNPQSPIPNPQSQIPNPKSKIPNPKSPNPPIPAPPSSFSAQSSALSPQSSSLWYASRHGEGKLERSARFVNHRANLWAARALGVQLVLSWNGVGAINPDLRVGDAVVPAAIMDWTRHRTNSFAEAGTEPGTGLFLAEAQTLRTAARTIDHIQNGRNPKQAARPFDERARQAIHSVLRIAYSEADNTPYATRNTTYVCTEGPRLETAAEIQLAADLGADVVGMTLCPEVWLAAELGLAYASLCLVTNFATGRKHLDPRRNFGPAVAERGLQLLLAAAGELNTDKTDETD